MNPTVRSSLIAGAIALVVYVVIALLTGSGFASAVGVGVVIGAATAIVTFLITATIRRMHAGS